MEKRKATRIKKRLLANIAERSAIICDISREGLQISMSSNPKTVIVDIKIDLEKVKYTLKGRVKWIRRNQIKRSSTIGICLKDIPEEYKNKLIEVFPVLAVDNETSVEITEINSMFGI